MELRPPLQFLNLKIRCFFHKRPLAVTASDQLLQLAIEVEERREGPRCNQRRLLSVTGGVRRSGSEVGEVRLFGGSKSLISNSDH